MPISSSCNPGDITVSVSAGAGEYLSYQVTAEAGATYVLESDPGGTLLSSDTCPSPCSLRWQPDPASAGTTIRHTLGMGFVGASRLEYLVEHRTSTDQLIHVVKRCVYTGGPGQYYEPLRVMVQ